MRDLLYPLLRGDQQAPGSLSVLIIGGCCCKKIPCIWYSRGCRGGETPWGGRPACHPISAAPLGLQSLQEWGARLESWKERRKGEKSAPERHGESGWCGDTSMDVSPQFWSNAHCKGSLCGPGRAGMCSATSWPLEGAARAGADPTE